MKLSVTVEESTASIMDQLAGLYLPDPCRWTAFDYCLIIPGTTSQVIFERRVYAYRIGRGRLTIQFWEPVRVEHYW